MIWDKPIIDVPPEQLKKAWEAWCVDNMRTSTALDMHLLNAGASPDAIGRAAYWMLQRARKAGEIRYVHGLWELIDRE